MFFFENTDMEYLKKSNKALQEQIDAMEAKHARRVEDLHLDAQYEIKKNRLETELSLKSGDQESELEVARLTMEHSLEVARLNGIIAENETVIERIRKENKARLELAEDIHADEIVAEEVKYKTLLEAEKIKTEAERAKILAERATVVVEGREEASRIVKSAQDEATELKGLALTEAKELYIKHITDLQYLIKSSDTKNLDTVSAILETALSNYPEFPALPEVITSKSESSSKR